MRRSAYAAGLIAVVLLLWLWQSTWISQTPTTEGSAETPPPELSSTLEAPRVKVNTFTSERHVREFVITGATVASEVVELKVQQKGEVEEVLVDEGDLVSQDQVLMRMKAEELPTALAEAEAMVRHYEVGRNSTRALRTQNYASETRTTEAAFRYESALLARERALLALERTRLIAPGDLIVHTRHAEVGAFLDTGDSVFTLVRLDPLDIEVYVSEQQVELLSVTERAEVLVEDTTVDAHISYISPLARTTTRSFRITLKAPNPNNAIKAGRTVQVRFFAPPEQAFKVPSSAIVLNNEGHTGVFTLSANNEAAFFPVTIIGGGRNSHWVKAAGSEALRIVTLGQGFLNPDTSQTVIPQP